MTVEVAMKTATGHEIPIDRSKTLACVEILEQLGTELRGVSYHVCEELATSPGCRRRCHRPHPRPHRQRGGSHQSRAAPRHRLANRVAAGSALTASVAFEVGEDPLEHRGELVDLLV